MSLTLRSRAALGAALITAAVSAAAVAGPATAADPPGPFACTTPSIFVAQGFPTQLSSVAYSSGSAVFTPIGSPQSPAYNSIAFNEADHYIYGMAGGTLIRIANDGSVTNLAATGLSTNNGAFDDAGNFYVGSGSQSFITKIDLDNPGAPTTIPLSDSLSTADFTFIDGKLWGDGVGTLVRIDPATGQVDQFSQSVVPTSVGAGAAWTFGNGNLGLGDNGSGTLYQVKITNPNSASPTFTLVSAAPGPGTSNNDATSCKGLPSDLGLTKTAPEKVPTGQEVTWTLTVHNYGPGNSSGYTVTDSIPAAVTNVATTTPGCTVNGNDVTCIGGPLDAGDEDTITITGDAPATPTALENSASVTGNEEDPTPGNNSSTSTTQASTIVGLCKGMPLSVLGLRPGTANGAETPCKTESHALLTFSAQSFLSLLPPIVKAGVLDGKSESTPTSAFGSADVADATVTLPGLTLSVKGVHTEAKSTISATSCTDTSVSGLSRIATLVINGKQYVIGDQPISIPIPGVGGVYVNQRVVSGSLIIQRAVFVDLPGTALDVVVAESKARMTCA